MRTKQLYTTPYLFVEEVELEEGIAMSDGVGADIEIFEEEDYTWVL